MSKPLWRSRTFWLNVVAAVLAVVNGSSVAPVAVPADLMAGVVAASNIALRLVTSQPVSLGGDV